MPCSIVIPQCAASVSQCASRMARSRPRSTMSAAPLRAPGALDVGDMSEAFIALGGNIGNVRETFERAIACVCRDAAVRLVARFGDHRTPPWGVTEQPPFINAAIAVATSLSPHELLARTMNCERRLGLDRARKQH